MSLRAVQICPKNSGNSIKGVTVFLKDKSLGLGLICAAFIFQKNDASTYKTYSVNY